MGQLHEALEIVDSMCQKGMQIPTEMLCLLLESCIKKKNLALGRKVHFHIMQSGYESDTVLGGDLIRMFAMGESLVESDLVFSKLAAPNNYSWRAIISAHVKLGHGIQAIKLYYKMRHSSLKPNGYVFVAALQACSSIPALTEGKQIHVHAIESGFELDTFVSSALIDMYTKCGSLKDACKLFDKMPKGDTVTWSAMIAGCTCHRHDQKALQVFQEMQQKGVQPDKVTFVSALKASSNILALCQGKLIHSLIIDSGSESSAHVECALITMYAKCVSLEDAQRVFDKLPKWSVVMFNALIAGYVLHTDYKLALQYFEDMVVAGVEPDGVTFVCLLSACSHLGQVEEGYHYYKSMTEVYGVMPTLQHHNCMVDILGRAGLISEAENLLNIVGWKALLNYSRLHGNVELGKQCFEQVVVMDGRHSAGYVLLSNAYADAGLWDSVCRIEELRKCAFALKIPGKSFIEVQNKVHEFVVGDGSHVQSNDIYGKLDRLYLQMKNKGYLPCMDLVLRPFLC